MEVWKTGSKAQVKNFPGQATAHVVPQYELATAIADDQGVAAAGGTQDTGHRFRFPPAARLERMLRNMVDDSGIVYDGAVFSLLDDVAQSRIPVSAFPTLPGAVNFVQ